MGSDDGSKTRATSNLLAIPVGAVFGIVMHR